MFKREVLSVYRRVFQIARTWQAASTIDTDSERQYIKDEARKLFRKNKEVTDPAEIKLCIHEANSRIELALHYGTPYPRLINMPPSAVPRTSNKLQKAQKRIRQQAKPVYLHSDDDVDK